MHLISRFHVNSKQYRKWNLSLWCEVTENFDAVEHLWLMQLVIEELCGNHPF